MKLAIEIWEKHIDVFTHFDLVCHSGNSLEDETKSNGLFNALTTLEIMHDRYKTHTDEIKQAITYLKGSKYYSDVNQDSDY